MKLKKLFYRRHHALDGQSRIRKHIPWISSPLQNHASSDDPHSTDSSSPLDPEAQSHGKDKLPRFKQRHESSTIELFYDLFFVANLATFTNNHEIVDSKCKLYHCLEVPSTAQIPRCLFGPVFSDRSDFSSSATELYRIFHYPMVHLASDIPF